MHLRIWLKLAREPELYIQWVCVVLFNDISDFNDKVFHLTHPHSRNCCNNLTLNQWVTFLRWWLHTADRQHSDIHSLFLHNDNCFRLCVTVVHQLSYKDKDEALFAMFDGGRNSEVPKILKKVYPNILAEEIEMCNKPSVYLKYSFLQAHKYVHQGVMNPRFIKLVTTDKSVNYKLWDLFLFALHSNIPWNTS